MNEEQLKQFEIKESHAVEGVTEDFIWYEASILRRDMQAWQHRFEKLVKVMEARYKDQNKMIQHYIDKCDDLQVEVSKLKDAEDKK